MPAISLTMIIPITASPRSRSSETSRCGFAGSVAVAGKISSPLVGAHKVPDRASVLDVLADFPDHDPCPPCAGELGLALERRQAVVRDVAATATAFSDHVAAQLRIAELRGDVLQAPS